MSNLGTVLEDWDAIQRVQVLAETWGHLDPVPGVTYQGYILFTLGCFGDITVIDTDFADLQGGPYFHWAVHEFIGDQIERKGNRYGGVWRFDGTLRVSKKGNARFSGKTRPMRTQYRFGARR